MEYRAYAELTDVPHVVVDGSAQPGTVLTLSHWPGAATPAPLRADLSAEIAFAYLDHPELHVEARFVTNNHFDQDGLVGVYALTEPDAALAHRDRLVDIARAGDFSCFHDRDAARAAIAIAALGYAGEADAYPAVLAELPRILADVDAYREHWAEQDEHITLTEQAIADGTITITEDPELDLAVVRVPPTWSERIVQQFMFTERHVAHTYAVYNATDRFAVVTLGAGPPELRYRYETWIQYCSRRPRPRVDLTAVATDLTRADTGDGIWTFDGVDALSPGLHRAKSDTTTIDDATFLAQVRTALTEARETWSPFAD
jgi:hypothetical protein